MSHYTAIVLSEPNTVGHPKSADDVYEIAENYCDYVCFFTKDEENQRIDEFLNFIESPLVKRIDPKTFELSGALAEENNVHIPVVIYPFSLGDFPIIHNGAVYTSYRNFVSHLFWTKQDKLTLHIEGAYDMHV